MPFSRPKLRIRSLMIAVAVVALLIAGGRWALEMRRLSAVYAEEAAIFAKYESDSLNNAIWFESSIASDRKHIVLVEEMSERARHTGFRSIDLLSKQIDTLKRGIEAQDRLARVCRKKAASDATLSRQYARAARYPWLGEPYTPRLGEPDIPPEPK